MEKRPVKCRFCKGQMYYSGDEMHTPEVTILVKSSNFGDENIDTLYIHKSCWKAGLEMIDSKGVLTFEND